MSDPGARPLPQPADDGTALIRASDRDRERIHTVLAEAMSAGALTPEEYCRRAGVAAGSQTRGELERLVVDLPLEQLGGAAAGLRSAAGNVTAVDPSLLGHARTTAIGVMSGASIGAGSVVGPTLRAVAVMGGVEIDLRHADFATDTVRITATAIMGGIDITVPEDVTLQVTGSGVMGGFDHVEEQGSPGAPKIKINGFALWGNVGIKRKNRRPRGSDDVG